MTQEEKAAAFDLIVAAFTNRWSNGKYGWFCLNPEGGPYRDTPEEIVPDFLEWCGRAVKTHERKAQRWNSTSAPTSRSGSVGPPSDSSSPAEPSPG